MAQKIARLSEEVINQIAAGEVVENPASIVKELIENSLDAGATRIEVEIEGGGQHLIRVEDNGLGMSREDAILCLERHATSKIRKASDLFALATMGFRGEALAAIAAVSRFELKTSEGGEGTRVAPLEGIVEPCARNRGTSVFVRSLFHNVPARRKFQKSPSASAAQVVRAVETAALAHPEVSFSLISHREKLLSVEAGEKRERIETLLGPFREEVSSNQIWGLLAAPEEARGQRRGQYLFVNRRPVFSPLVARAVQTGYGTRLAEGLFPPFVLFLELAPEEVDVNVHPQKREVRFREEGKVFRRVEEAVAASFSSAPSPFVSPLSFEPPPFLSFSLREEETLASQEQEALPISFAEKPLFVFGHFLFVEKGGLWLIDLRRAEARILFEALRGRKGTAQALIWPLEIAADGEDLAEELQKMGIECRWIGKKTLAIDALPAPLEAADFPQFLTAWRENKKLEEAVCYRGKRRSYSLAEAISIWQQLMQCREKEGDPLGKPIWKEVEASDLERLF